MRQFMLQAFVLENNWKKNLIRFNISIPDINMKTGAARAPECKIE